MARRYGKSSRRRFVRRKRTIKKAAAKKAARIAKRTFGGKYKRSRTKKRVRSQINALGKWKGADPLYMPSTRQYVTKRYGEGRIDLSTLLNDVTAVFPSYSGYGRYGRGRSMEIMFDPLNFAELIPSDWVDQRVKFNESTGAKFIWSTKQGEYVRGRGNQTNDDEELIEPVYEGYSQMSNIYRKCHVLQTQVDITFEPSLLHHELHDAGKIAFALFYQKDQMDRPNIPASHYLSATYNNQTNGEWRPNNYNSFQKQQGSLIGIQYLDFNNANNSNPKKKTISFVWDHKQLYKDWRDDMIVDNPALPLSASKETPGFGGNQKLAGDYGHHFAATYNNVQTAAGGSTMGERTVKRRLNTGDAQIYNDNRGMVQSLHRPRYFLQIWKCDHSPIPVTLDFTYRQKSRIVCHHPRMAATMKIEFADQDHSLTAAMQTDKIQVDDPPQ